MGKVKQTEQQLQNHLKEQLELLELLGAAYDSGKKVAAKQIATVVRVLVHDTANSHSLLSQLQLKSGDFFDSCLPDVSPINEGQTRIGSFAGIVGMGVGPQGSYIPYLDEVPRDTPNYVAFEDYWNRIVLIDTAGAEFSRRKLILRVANQDGGAHVDPEIDDKYANLILNNSMGWKVNRGDGVETDLEGVELATVRQIGHEMLRSLKRDMPTKEMQKDGILMTVGGMSMWVGKAATKAKNAVFKRSVPKVGRNEPCPCGSKMKYKKCHGK